LRIIQRQVPLVERPYEHIARQLGQTGTQVMETVRLLRDRGVIREVSGLFDARLLGYRQVLVAFELSPERLDAGGAAVAEHPGVSHCYAREGSRYNLWFTLAVSGESTLGLEATAERLAQQTGAGARLLLPSLRRYKLRVEFFGGSDRDDDEFAVSEPQEQAVLSDDDRRTIPALQMDLPCRERPFEPLAQAAGVTVAALLARAEGLQARGCLRRFCALLHHRAAGAAANVMVVWRVEEGAADAAGSKCAALDAVSHCYLRPTAGDWPYNLYTMVHGRSHADAELAIAEIVAVTGLRERCELWTTREYKKKRIILLDDRERQWELAQTPP
jgi:DNA-binding Lrp family transcriptional regulator